MPVPIVCPKQKTKDHQPMGCWQQTTTTFNVNNDTTPQQQQLLFSSYLNSVIIYTLIKPVSLSSVQHKISFEQMSWVFFSQKSVVIKTFRLPLFFKIFFFVLRRKQVKQVWIDMRVNKWQQNLFLGFILNGTHKRKKFWRILQMSLYSSATWL